MVNHNILKFRREQLAIALDEMQQSFYFIDGCINKVINTSGSMARNMHLIDVAEVEIDLDQLNFDIMKITSDLYEYQVCYQRIKRQIVVFNRYIEMIDSDLGLDIKLLNALAYQKLNERLHKSALMVKQVESHFRSTISLIPGDSSF